MGCKFDLRVGLFTQNKMHSRVNGFQGSHVSGFLHGFIGEGQCNWVICLSGHHKATCKCTRDILSLLISQFSVSQVLRDHRQWWTSFSSLKEGSPFHLLLFTDAFLKGWNAQLRHRTASGLWYHEESRLHIDMDTSFRIIWKSASESISVDFHRQFISGGLSEQAGRHPLSGNVCNQGLDKCQEDSASVKTHPRVS